MSPPDQFSLSPDSQADAPSASGTPAAARNHRRRTGEEPLDPANIPTVAEFEAQIRRRPLGSTLADICLDLGIAPNLCTGWLWNRVFESLIAYDGNLDRFLLQMRHRRDGFARSDIACNPAMRWPERTREDTSRALGFFIGEPPVLPSDPLALMPVSMTAFAGTAAIPAATATASPGVAAGSSGVAAASPNPGAAPAATAPAKSQAAATTGRPTPAHAGAVPAPPANPAAIQHRYLLAGLKAGTSALALAAGSAGLPPIRLRGGFTTGPP